MDDKSNLATPPPAAPELDTVTPPADPETFLAAHLLGNALRIDAARLSRHSVHGGYDTLAITGLPGDAASPTLMGTLARLHLTEGGRLVLTAHDPPATLEIVRGWCDVAGLFVLLEEELLGGWGVVAVPQPEGV